MSEPVPIAAPAFDEPGLEQQYQAYRAALNSRAGAQANSVLLLVSLVLFVVANMSGGASVSNVALLAAVLILHEGGHWLGMRLFGYRDVKVFFIPFFGAATSGKRGGVAAWKEAVVLLMGPLPGILLGAVCAILAVGKPDPLWHDAAIMLLLINGFNLLPLGGLDGGQLFQRVLFSRQRHLEIVFLVVAGAALLALAILLKFWFLAFFAYLGLAAIPRRHRILKAVEKIRRERGTLGLDVRQLDDAESRAVFLGAREAIPQNARLNPRMVATAAEELVDAARPAPGVGATLILIGGWLLGVLFALVVVVAVALTHGRSWKQHSDAQGHFSVELPSEPLVGIHPESTPAGTLPVHRTFTTVDLVKRYTITWLDSPTLLDPKAATGWIDARRDAIGRELEARVVSEQPIELQGIPGREVRYATSRRAWRGRFFVVGAREYEVFVSAPEIDNECLRALDSFRITR